MPLISRPSLYTHEMTHSARAALRTNVRSNMWSGFYYATTLYFPPPFFIFFTGVAAELGVSEIHISLSDERHYALAFAVAVNDPLP